MYDVPDNLTRLAFYGNPYIDCPNGELLKESWLTEGNVTANFICPKCGVKQQIEVSRRVPSLYLKSHVHLCQCTEGELHTCQYCGTEPRNSGLVVKTTFEKNGRKAIRTSFSNGKSVVRSQTKENSLQSIERGTAVDKQTGKRKEIASSLTSSCQESCNKVKQEIILNKGKQLQNYMQRQEAQRSKK